MTQTHTVVLASDNPGKIREFQALLGPAWALIPQGEMGIAPVEETGATLVENALQKARHAAAISGLPALADDSGIEVDALDGAPGVFSARYAGPHASDAANNARLLAALDGIPAASRTARYRCVLVLVRSADDPVPLIAEGTWEGRIADAPTGSGGFGYDPLFVDQESGFTAASMDPGIKNARSHRGAALRVLQRFLATET